MSRIRGGTARRRCFVLAPAVVALYALLLAAGPLDHHDVACHVKSATHCATCVHASVPGTEARSGADIVPLVSADSLRFERTIRPVVATLTEPGDRSPPSV